METFSALQDICRGNSPVTDEFPARRPVTRSFNVFFYLRPNKRLSKQWWGWWFETPSRPIWCHCNGSRALNKWKPGYNDTHFADYIFIFIFLHKNCCIFIQISPKLLPMVQLQYASIVHIMIWHPSNCLNQRWSSLLPPPPKKKKTKKKNDIVVCVQKVCECD